MYIKRYTIASLILIGLVGWYVHSYLTQDTYSIDIFGIHLPALSIAVWVIAPLIVLYVFSVIHMAFYSLLGNLKLRKYDKDFEAIIDGMVDAYLGKKERKHNYKTERYELLGSLIDNTTFVINNDVESDVKNEKINAVLKLIGDVKSGNVVDLKLYGLKNDNPLVIQNNHNKYKNGIVKMDDVLNNSADYDQTLCESVYLDFVEIASLASIEKHKAFMTKEALFKILRRIGSEEHKIEASTQELISLFHVQELTNKEYIEISKILSSSLMPEERIKLFEMLSSENEQVMDVYLYTLFDLEMNSMAAEILEVSQPEEYVNFKAYFALKDSDNNFSIDLFV